MVKISVKIPKDEIKSKYQEYRRDYPFYLSFNDFEKVFMQVVRGLDPGEIDTFGVLIAEIEYKVHHLTVAVIDVTPIGEPTKHEKMFIKCVEDGGDPRYFIINSYKKMTIEKVIAKIDAFN